MGSATETKLDTEGAQAYKDEHEQAIKAVEAEAAALTGKENKKAKTEKTKEASGMKNDPKYIDACKVLKGLDAPNGNFMTKVASPSAAAKAKEEEDKKKAEEEKAAAAAAAKAGKDDKKPAKKVESAGISKAERD